MISSFICSWFFLLGFTFGYYQHRRRHKHKKRVFIELVNLTEGELQMDMKVNDQRTYGLVAKDEFDNLVALPAFDAVPTWSVNDASLLSIVPAADGLSAVVTSPAGKLGPVEVDFAGLEGGSQVVGTDQFSMIAGDVAKIQLVAQGPDVPAPAPTPAA